MLGFFFKWPTDLRTAEIIFTAHRQVEEKEGNTVQY